MEQNVAGSNLAFFHFSKFFLSSCRISVYIKIPHYYVTVKITNEHATALCTIKWNRFILKLIKMRGQGSLELDQETRKKKKE